MYSRTSARQLAASLGGWRTRDPAYEALADGIRLLCLDNRLAPATVLPAERELATALGVSRTTVAAAYRSLRETEHIESTRGSGSVTVPLRRHDPGSAMSEAHAIDLQQASPPAWPGLAGVMTQLIGAASGVVSRVGYDTIGQPELRARIAAAYTARGIPTDARDILVTTGAQSAIHLLATVLLRRGEPVAIETPTYPHAADAFREAGGRLVGVPVTTDAGWDLDRVSQAFARTRPAVAYLMPDFHNPTGRSMTAGEREAIAAAADRAGTTVIVDETTADLDIDREVPPPVFGARSVVRIGSLGKTVWGGLRVGWIRADASLVRRLAVARSAHDLGTPELEQAVASALLPRMPEIVAQRSHLLGEGRDALVDALVAAFPGWRIPAVDGGVSLWVELDAPLSAPLVMAARARGLLLSAGPRFAAEGGHDRHLRIPFTAPPDVLVRATRILAEAWTDVRSGSTATLVDSFDAVI